MAATATVSYALKSGYDAYLSLDENQYRGEWVAIYGGKVISHNKDAKKAYEEANRLTKGRPFMLTRITASQFEVL